MAADPAVLGIEIEPKPKSPSEGDGAKAETDDDILEEARKRYQSCTDNDSDNRKDALFNCHWKSPEPIVSQEVQESRGLNFHA